MSHSPLTCPACRELLDPEIFAHPPASCTRCGALIGFSSAPFLIGLLLGFAASIAVVQLLGIKAYAAILWLPILVLCIWYVTPIAARLAASVLKPLRVITAHTKGSHSYKSTLYLFASFWFGLVLM